MKFNRVCFAIAASAAMIVSGFAGISPANASAIDIHDPGALVGALAPQVADNVTTDDSHVSLTAPAVTARRTAATETPHVAVAPLGHEEPGTSGESVGTGISIDYAKDVVSEASGYTVLSTSSPNVAAYVQPTQFGVSVLTAIANADAPAAYSYTFDVPDGTTVRENKQGLALLGPFGDSLGQIAAPWAVDSQGISLPTRYEWEGKTLSQFIDLSDKRITFPVLADPAWGYTLSYSMKSTTVGQVWSKMMLNNCFGGPDCYFPIAGAPRYFPAANQFLPLTVSFYGAFQQNFNCYFDSYYYQNYGGGEAYFGFMFRAAPGHIDGVGSTIEFDFNPAWDSGTPSNKYAQLVVSAYIMNDVGALKVPYVAGANISWSQFASNLNS